MEKDKEYDILRLSDAEYESSEEEDAENNDGDALSDGSGAVNDDDADLDGGDRNYGENCQKAQPGEAIVLFKQFCQMETLFRQRFSTKSKNSTSSRPSSWERD